MLHQVSRSGCIEVPSDTSIKIGCDPNAIRHDITILAGTATAGTIAVKAVPPNTGVEEVVLYGGSALTQNLSTLPIKTYIIDGTFDTINLSCSGSDGTYKYSYRGL